MLNWQEFSIGYGYFKKMAFTKSEDFTLFSLILSFRKQGID